MLHLRRSLWRKGRLALHQWMLEGETKSDLNKSSWPSKKRKGKEGEWRMRRGTVRRRRRRLARSWDHAHAWHCMHIDAELNVSTVAGYMVEPRLRRGSIYKPMQTRHVQHAREGGQGGEGNSPPLPWDSVPGDQRHHWSGTETMANGAQESEEESIQYMLRLAMGCLLWCGMLAKSNQSAYAGKGKAKETRQTARNAVRRIRRRWGRRARKWYRDACRYWDRNWQRAALWQKAAAGIMGCCNGGQGSRTKHIRKKPPHARGGSSGGGDGRG